LKLNKEKETIVIITAPKRFCFKEFASMHACRFDPELVTEGDLR